MHEHAVMLCDLCTYAHPQAMNKTLSTLVSDEDTLNAELSSKQAQLASLNKDLEDLKAKKDRVNKQV